MQQRMEQQNGITRRRKTTCQKKSRESPGSAMQDAFEARQTLAAAGRLGSRQSHP